MPPKNKEGNDVEAQRNTEANIGAASSSDLEASGAFMEPQVKESVDVDSVSVDNNPRAGTSVLQNRIDFNDPTARDSDLVAEATKVDPAEADVQSAAESDTETRRTRRGAAPEGAAA